MRTWAPLKLQSLADQAALTQKMRNAAISALRSYEPDNVIAVGLILSAFDGSPFDILHPAFFEWSYAVQDAKEKGGDALRSLVDPLACVVEIIKESKTRAAVLEGLIGATIDIEAGVGVHLTTLERAEATAQEIHARACEINLLTQLSEDQIKVIRRAFLVLSTYWPEMHEEIQDFVQQIFFFDSSNVIGFVDFRSHGSIFLRQEVIAEEVRLAEEILHESSHVRLNTILAIEPLFLNADEVLYPSPLRREPRPMFGVFHQMFVLSRLHAFYDRIPCPTEIQRERHSKIREHLCHAFSVVEHHALLTPGGQQIISSVRTLVEHLS